MYTHIYTALVCIYLSEFARALVLLLLLLLLLGALGLLQQRLQLLALSLLTLKLFLRLPLLRLLSHPLPARGLCYQLLLCVCVCLCVCVLNI